MEQGGIVTSRVALRIIYIHTLPDFNTKDHPGGRIFGFGRVPCGSLPGTCPIWASRKQAD